MYLVLLLIFVPRWSVLAIKFDRREVDNLSPLLLGDNSLQGQPDEASSPEDICPVDYHVPQSKLRERYVYANPTLVGYSV